MDVEECRRCHGSGEIAIDAKTCRYVAAGPVPDDAKGVVGSTCFNCGGTGYVEVPDELDDEECGNFSAGSPPR